MSKKQKLIERLRSLPTDMTWDEAKSLMTRCGFEELKNDGSRRAFRHKSGRKVFLHAPHNPPTLPQYALKDMIQALIDTGEIE